MNDTTDLWDWRRRIADLYAGIRSQSDPQAAWRLWCDTRTTLFRDHPQSPIEPSGRLGNRAPVVFAYDPSLRFEVQLRLPDATALMRLPAGLDGELPLRPFARTCGLAEALGGELTLYWIEGYGGGVFLPFGDATNRGETYGGGRYLLDTIKGADLGTAPNERAILDFNFAYFPSCAYSDRYVCPLSPAANRLPAAIRAGERS